MANGVVERGKDDYSSASGSESDDNNENQPHKNGTSSVSVNANSDVRDNSGYLNSVARQNSGGHFGDVNITNSTDILVGNKAYLNGDVTINQYIYPKGIEEENPITDHLPIPKDITIKTDKGNFKLQNGNKTHPILHITQQQSVSEKGFVREWWRWMSCAFAGALLVLSTLLFLLWVIGAIRPRDDGTTNEPTPAPPKQYPFVIPENLTDDNKVLLSDQLHFVQRDEWLARSPDPNSQIVTLKLPIPFVVIHHTVTPQCFTVIDCMKLMISIQDYHMKEDYGDIGYNFVIGGDGYVYVAASWESMGAHTYPYNRCTIAIAFIGNYNNDHLNEEQKKTLQLLLYMGVKMGKIQKDYRLYGASTISNTESPGKNIIKYLETLPHHSIENVNVTQCLKRTDLINVDKDSRNNTILLK